MKNFLNQSGDFRMNLEHDLSAMLAESFHRAGIKIPKEWSDSDIRIKYYEFHQRIHPVDAPCYILYSEELLRKRAILPELEKIALTDIESRLKSGQPVTRYLSRDWRTISTRKSDFLLKNWNIYHLHLERTDLGGSLRDPCLLFFTVKGRVVHMIDIKKHPKGSDWFDRELLETIYHNWPWLLKMLSGIKPSIDVPDHAVHALTKQIVTILPFHGGALIPTSMGVSSAGTSFMATQCSIYLHNNLARSEQYLSAQEEKEKIQEEILRLTGIWVEHPDYRLIFENGFFAAHEIHTSVKIRLFPDRYHLMGAGDVL